MPRQTRVRPVTPSQARAYLAKATEYLDAAEASLEAGRRIAATSLAIHAAINGSAGLAPTAWPYPGNWPGCCQ